MRDALHAPAVIRLAAFGGLVHALTAGAQAKAPVDRARDCLGATANVPIRPGQIGQLRLDLPLNEIRRRCPTLTWSTVNGDEELDTAIVLERPGFRVTAAVAVIGDEDGFHRPVRIDERQTVRWWQAAGESGVLPDGVPLTATWADVRRAYGPLGALALNGTVYVEICRQPGLRLLMDIPKADAPINGVPANVVDSVMASSRIRAVVVASSAVAPRRKC